MPGDIIIGADTFEEYLYYLELVLKRMMEFISEKTCEFCCSKVVCSGYLLDKDGLRPNPDRVQPVLDFPVPKTVQELRRLLDMVG